MPGNIEHRTDEREDINSSRNTSRETSDNRENTNENNDNQAFIDSEKEWEKYERSEYDRIKTKEDIKYFMDKAKNSQELYENAIKVLKNMESNFRDTIFEIADQENWDAEKTDLIRDSSFNSKLNTDNPVTLFEKKGSEILKKAEELENKINTQNSGAQVVWSWEIDWEKVDENERNALIEELYQLRLDAIQNFKDDIEDGFLSNENNVSAEKIRNQGRWLWTDLFAMREVDKKRFEENIDKMNLTQLIFATFNIEKWSWAFTYSYWKLKEKLWDKNLFNYIDEQNKSWDQTSEALKYSAFKMLFQRRMTWNLNKMLDGYSWDKEELMQFISKNIKEDKDFKIAFLTSIKDAEKSEYFGKIAQDLKENDTDVKKAYEAASNIDNIDIFKDGKINALMIYDNEGHGWWSSYFDSNLKYYQNKGFSSKKVDNPDYTKYVLKKWNDTITLVKIKKLQMDNMEDEEIKNVLKSIVDQQDYNLFSLRWHCYNTEQVIWILWSMNAVWEWDLLIDGWCNNSINTGDYYKSWVKWQICTYTSTGKWDSTQAFVDRIMNAKNSWKSFSDVLWYYNSLTTDTTVDWYFAFSTERPDSVWAQYKKLAETRDLDNIVNWLTQDLNTPVGQEESGRQEWSREDWWWDRGNQWEEIAFGEQGESGSQGGSREDREANV